MDGSQFDRVSRLFARRRLTRRQALAEGGAALATAGLAAAGVTAVSAQEATPAAEAGAPGAANGPEMLFVQSFQSGSIVPTEGVEGRFTVTLEHGLGQTIYFSDRPDRIVGASPTPRFLDGLGFRPDNPPNAALVVENAAGETDIAVVELFSPVYDPAGPTVTYEVAVLANWENSLELGFAAAPTDLAAVEPTFGAAHLFIDGCVDSAIKCVIKDNSGYNHDFLAGSIPSADFGGWCYEDLDLEHLDCPYTCVPCDARFPCSNAMGYMTDMCNQRFSNCYGQCVPEGF